MAGADPTARRWQKRGRLSVQASVDPATPADRPAMPTLRHALHLVFACAVLLARPATAAELAADINTGLAPVRSSEPDGFVLLDSTGLSYFRACDTAHGCELWETDGTGAGTRLRADICPGPCSSAPAALTAAFGDMVLFVADDGQHGREPWVLAPGILGPAPQLLVDALPGRLGSQPAGFLPVPASGNGLGGVFFSAAATDPTRGADSLWRVTLSTSQVLALPVLQPGTVRAMGVPAGASARLFFTAQAENVSSGSELWTATAGSGGSVNVALVQDIAPGAASSAPDALTYVAATGLLYFSAFRSDVGFEPWRSDGTAAGTLLLGDLRPGTASSSPREFTALGSAVLFRASTAASAPFDRLWRSTGSVAGTSEVAGGGGDPRHLTPLGSRVVYVAEAASAGREFHAVDGAGSAALVTNLVAGSSGIDTGNGISLNRAAAGGGFVHFFDFISGRLYRTDGSAAGTRQVGGSPAFGSFVIGGLHARADRLLFGWRSSTTVGLEPHVARYDLPGQIALLKNIGDEVGHSNPTGFTTLDSRTLVFAFEQDTGMELRRLDGGTATLLSDAAPGNSEYLDAVSSTRGDRRRAVLSGTPRRLYFSVGGQLWGSDGSVGGTGPVVDLNALRPDTGGIRCVTAAGDHLLVLAHNFSAAGASLWRSDGTPGGTQLLLAPELVGGGHQLDYFFCPVVVGPSILLTGVHSNTGYNLYRSNGQPGHLSVLLDIAPGPAHTFVDEDTMAQVGSRLFFVASDEANDANEELWVTDGTSQGTRLVKDLDPAGGSSPVLTAALAGGVFFGARTPGAGIEPFFSDGSAAGTVALGDLLPGHGSSLPATQDAGERPAVSGTRVFFAASGGSAGSGTHLAVSDGSPAGTRRIAPAGTTAPIAPRDLVGLGDGSVVFTAVTPETGRELWFSDGTDAGTFRVADIRPGPDSSGPMNLHAEPGRVLFSADDGSVGREVWQLLLDRPDALFGDSFEPSSP